jgi:16S rRNA (uracil1498-N3)-methyltransferase
MNIFYDPSLNGSEQYFTLNPDESAHACRVLRMREGQEMTLLNGRGARAVARIIDANPKGCQVSLVNVEFQESSNLEIHIAIAPTKNSDRMEWLFEKATEIGITEITLLSCRNSERKSIREDRLEKILVSAMKQSQRSFLPRLNPMIGLKEFVQTHPNGLIAHCEETEKNTIENAWKPNHCPILIGPEGDFSHDEIEMARTFGYTPITLGNNRLRTETAGLVACIHAVLISQKL